MITVKEMEAEVLAEMDLDAEFVDRSPEEDDTNIYELRAAKVAILLEFYAQDTPIVGGDTHDHYPEEGWDAQEPWFSRMPYIPVPETDQ